MLRLRLELPRKAFVISVDFEVQTGSSFCLFGPSATGKSSILSVIAGFEQAYTAAYLSLDGQVLVDTSVKPKRFCPPWRRGIAYLEQSARLFPHLTVEQNILYGISDKRQRDWCDQIIARLGLQEYLTFPPHRLSGGLTQRVALARALATRPQVLLLDEPFSALDWMSRHTLQDVVRDIHRTFPVTILLVTHQLSEAQRMADQIGLVDNGRILQTGTPSELMTAPASLRAAQLLGYTPLCPDAAGMQYAIHPDRVILGAMPDRGVVATGSVRHLLWHEGRKRAQVAFDTPWQATLEVNLPVIADIEVGMPITVTFIDPPKYTNVLSR